MEQQVIANGGLQYVPQIAAEPQIVYLDFDGESTTYRNDDLDITIDVDIEDSGMSEEQKRYILAKLSEIYASEEIVFTIEKPEEEQEYSTIFIGQTDDFEEYGSFAGLAETIDKGNLIKDDNAFVLADSTSDLDTVISVIDHEIGHIVNGEKHSFSYNSLNDYCCTTGIMMSTLWNQSGIVNIAGNSTITYNHYCPIDPTTGKKSITGCTNTAASQIIYYYIEKFDFDLQLSLDAADAYVSSKNSAVINIKADGSTPGTVSFSQINQKLADFDIKSADDIAALNYACGVVQEAGYSSSATGAHWDIDLFYRAGFDCAIKNYVWNDYYQQKYWYWGSADSYGKYRISSEAYDVLIENLNAGLVVGLEYEGHSLVLDGYNADNDTFHINFGWGNHYSTSWYTREQIYQQQYWNFIYDIKPDVSINLYVTDSDVYGTGTFIRAWEQANGTLGQNIINVSDSLDGADQVWKNYLVVSDDTIVNNMNIDVMVVDSINSWAFGFWNDSDKENKLLTFNDFSGSMIVNTAKTETAVFCCDAAVHLDFSGALIYAGNYSRNGSYTQGAECVLSQLENWQTNDTTISSAVLDKLDGRLFLSNAGASVSHVVNIKDRSFVSGAIQTDGKTTVNIDSTSMFYTDVFQDTAFNIDLCSPATDAPIITVMQYMNNFNYYDSVITVSVGENSVGDYTIVGTMDDTRYVDLLRKLDIIIKRTGKSNETLNVHQGNTATGDGRIQLSCSNGTLNLKVTPEPDKTAPVLSNVWLKQESGSYTFSANVTAYDNMTAVGDLIFKIKYATSESGLAYANAISGKQFTLTPNAAGKTYYFQLSATDKAGNTATSSVQSFYINDETVPTLVGTPRAVVSGDSVTISWEHANDNVGIEGYYLTVDGKRYTVSGNSFTINDLSVGTHTYNLSAYDAVGHESSKSANETFTISQKSNYDLTTEKWLDNWGGCINISTKINTVKDSELITKDDNVYLDWCIYNEGDNINTSFHTALYLDNKLLYQWITGELLHSSYLYLRDYDLGKLSVGTHTVKIVADYLHDIAEVNENNNTYTKTFTVEENQSVLSGTEGGVSFKNIPGDDFIVEYSTNSFANSLQIETESNAVDTFGLPAGTYQWRVKGDGEFVNGENIVSNNSATPQNFVSDADGNMDVFFSNANGTWGAGYAAEHHGVLNGWSGTREQVMLFGKNKIADVFSGSSDANVLVLTDDSNGDALFVEDIYTSFGKDAARLTQIDEIRAGAGDDIVDMTSQKFAYAGDEMTIRGGLGNDVIWAAGGDNDLFGDAGNDRIIGSKGFDLIVGGAGNDNMHTGGGGNDIFAFCENWGKDTVQLTDSDSYIALWFASGSESNWDAANRIYRDGSNSVTVLGGAGCTIDLKFGDEGGQYDDMVSIGAFESAASEKIFEDKNSGMLA